MAEKELAPWRPFKDLSSFRDRLWDSFFWERPLARICEWVVPSLDLSETKDNFVVKAEVPGMDAKDISISLTGDVLTIKGEKKQEKEEKEEDYHVVERSYGSFSRSIRLPAEVESGKVEASYKHGILRITLPKSEKVKAKEVKIKVE
jgi:HSP20 family protein